jgi:hypothetical protein
VFLISERVVRSTRFGRAFGKNVIIFGRGALSEPAFRANHPRPERWHGEFAREMVDIHDHLVPALVALDRKRPNVVLPHVGEVHWLDRIVEADGGHLVSSPLDLIPGDFEGLNGRRYPCVSKRACRSTPLIPGI